MYSDAVFPMIVCAGQKTCMHVHGVFPYLFVRYHAAAEPLSSYLQEFAAGLDKAIKTALGNATSTRQHVYKISLVSGMSVSIFFFFGRPLGLGLCHRKSVRPSVCNVGVLWPNGLSDRDDFWHTPCPGQQ